MKCREDRRDVVMTIDDERRRPDELPHSVPTASDRDGRRQRRQEVSCNSLAGNSQTPGPEHALLQASETDG